MATYSSILAWEIPWTVAYQSSVHGFSKAKMLEWVVVSFSRVSSQPRDQTCVSCIAGGFFTTSPPGKPTGPISSVQSLSRVLLFVTP